VKTWDVHQDSGKRKSGKQTSSSQRPASRKEGTEKWASAREGKKTTYHTTDQKKKKKKSKKGEKKGFDFEKGEDTTQQCTRGGTESLPKKKAWSPQQRGGGKRGFH